MKRNASCHAKHHCTAHLTLIAREVHRHQVTEVDTDRVLLLLLVVVVVVVDLMLLCLW
jgi:hypothetical protein